MSKLLHLSFQGWIKKAKQIQCPAPLPENPAIPLLTKMLVPAPYKAPEKKAKKKGQEARSGLRRKGTSDATSEDAETHSSPAENDEEEEESNSPPEGGRRKGRPLEAEAPNKGKVSLAGNSALDTDSSSDWRPRENPLAES